MDGGSMPGVSAYKIENFDDFALMGEPGRRREVSPTDWQESVRLEISSHSPLTGRAIQSRPVAWRRVCDQIKATLT